MPIKDPEERKAYHRRYNKMRYENDSEYRAKQLAASKRSDARRRDTARKLVESWKETGCAVCDETTTCCLVAHHIDPGTKEFNVADGANRYSVDRLKKELAKCICICMNCHAKVHGGLVELPSQTV